MRDRYQSTIKEELVAAGVLMAVVVTGTFLMAQKTLTPSVETKERQTSSVLGVNQNLEEDIDTMVSQALSTPKPSMRPTPTPRPVEPISQPIATESSRSAITPSVYKNTVIEQPYGVGGNYDNDNFRLSIENPRLVVSASRVFKVDVILANKKVEAGLKNRLSATIIKEGAIIATSAPFSLSDSATVYPGEQMTFTATMSLISGTDVARLKYFPMIEGLPEIEHDL